MGMQGIQLNHSLRVGHIVGERGNNRGKDDRNVYRELRGVLNVGVITERMSITPLTK